MCLPTVLTQGYKINATQLLTLDFAQYFEPTSGYGGFYLSECKQIGICVKTELSDNIFTKTRHTYFHSPFPRPPTLRHIFISG